MSRSKFIFLSLFWGTIMSFIGVIAAIGLLITGHKPKKYGYCYHFEVDKALGGVSLGCVIITGKNASTHTKDHEHGHALQNCIYGPLMLFVIGIPSFIRCQYYNMRYKLGMKNKDYDSIWFEGDATKRGTQFMNAFRAAERNTNDQDR